MKKSKPTSKAQDKKVVSLINDPYLVMWVLLDRTRDTIAKARDMELAHYQLSRVQVAVLHTIMLENRELTIAEIADGNVREHNSVLSLLNRMEKAGLVQKIQDDNFNRIKVRLTEKGRELYASATRLSLEMIFSILSAEEQQQLKSILTKLRTKSRELLGVDYRPPFLPE